MRLTQLIWENSVPSLAVWSDKSCGWIDAAFLLSVIGYEMRSPLTLHSLLREDDPKLTLDSLYNAWKKHEDGELREAAKISPVSGRVKSLLEPTVKIVCVGLNYREHAKEFGDDCPDNPVIFCKASSSLNWDGMPIVLPALSNSVDYEGELVVVIGKTCKNASKDHALDYVAGYTCGNDVSARDWQFGNSAKQWFLGKSFDSFAPVGPCLVTKDEIRNPNCLDISTRVNGEVVQSSNTKFFIFQMEEIISYVSSVMTLNPGDLIFTGTPSGVGGACNPPRYLKKGDSVSVHIECIGDLNNPIV